MYKSISLKSIVDQIRLDHPRFDIAFSAFTSALQELLIMALYAFIPFMLLEWRWEPLYKYSKLILGLVVLLFILSYKRSYFDYKSYRNSQKLKDYYGEKGQYQRYYEEGIIQAECAMDLAKNDIDRYSKFSIYAVLAVIFTQLLSNDAFPDHIMQASNEIVDTLSKGKAMQFEDIKLYGVLCCIVLFTLLNCLLKHRRGHILYRKWRVRKMRYILDWESEKARMKAAD